ncbi:MAG: polysulfide reductase NrfD [Acidobacteria bacterium]|nr:polysulfide reductase NrfD [Acidobacteriota bacterium]
MANLFNTELRAQQEWSWQLALDLFLGGLGGGLFLLYQTIDLPPVFALVSIGLVIAGAVVLLTELGHPLRAWRAIFKARSSWISRGVLLVSVFVVTACIHIAPTITNSSWRIWGGDDMGAKVISVAAALSALGITLYPGFVISASRSIPFWDTPMLPAIFFTQSMMGGCGILLLASAFDGGQGMPQAASLTIATIFLNLAMIAGYLLLMRRTGAPARESVRLLLQTRLRGLFWLGAVGAGMVLPLVLLSVQSAVGTATVAGALLLSGGLLFRYCMLKAGVYLPLPLAGIDLSKLNRTTDQLAREYSGWTARR